MSPEDKKDRSALSKIVHPIIDGADKDFPLSPAWVATQAMERATQNSIRIAAHYAFREIARSVMRIRLVPSPIGPRAKIEEQLDLPGFELLHDKYPKPDGSGYVLIESLTIEEAEWNADQLEKLGRAAIAHAHQLRRWISTRRRAS